MAAGKQVPLGGRAVLEQTAALGVRDINPEGPSGRRIVEPDSQFYAGRLSLGLSHLADLFKGL